MVVSEVQGKKTGMSESTNVRVQVEDGEMDMVTRCRTVEP